MRRAGSAGPLLGELLAKVIDAKRDEEILRNQPKPNDRASSKPATETRGGKITTYYTDRLASIAIGIAFLIAIAAVVLLRFGFEVDILSTLGATLSSGP